MKKTIIWAAIAAGFAVTISGVLIFMPLDDVEAAPAGPKVPVGAVLDWFCVDPCTIPPGYVLADGSVVDDPSSPLDGVTLPDLRETFVRGAATTDDVGDTGGSPGEHTHSVDPPNTETTSDSHFHGVDGDLGGATVFNGFSPGGCVAGCNLLVADHNHNIGTLTAADDDHSHAVETSPFDSASSDGLPPFVDLVKIIRIKVI